VFLEQKNSESSGQRVFDKDVMCMRQAMITDVLSPGDGAIDFDPRVFARHSD